MTDNAANKRKAFSVVASSDEPEPDADEEASLHWRSVEWEEVEDDVLFAVLARYSCVAHTLQLVVQDGIKESMVSWRQVMGKCKKLVASFHTSCKASELLENEADGQTGRWWSAH